jgi:hypothetical protein
LLTSTNTTTTTTEDDDDDDDDDFYQKYKNKKCLYHFAYIKNLSRLVNHQIGNIKNKTWFCERCFNHFSSEMILKQHLLDCEKLNNTKIVFPETERIMEFKGFKNKIKVPFVIYADLENILVKYNESGDCGGVNVNKKMHKYQKHEPFSIAYYLKCSYNDTLSNFFFFFFLNYSLSPFTTTGLSGTLRSAFFFSFFLCGAAGLRGTFPGYPRPPSLLLPPFSGRHNTNTNTNIHGRPIRPGIRTLLTSRWCRKSVALPSTTLPSAPERHTHTSMARRRFLPWKKSSPFGEIRTH